MLANVGHGITKTGSSLKGMAGHMINAPLDIAQKVRRGVFGSADNIANISTEGALSDPSFYLDLVYKFFYKNFRAAKKQ